MIENTEARDNKMRMLSQQLDKQIKQLNSQPTQNNQQVISTLTPFDLLEQKLRRLQQKLQKVKQSDSKYIYKQRKNSSSNNSKISTSRNHLNDKKTRFNYQSVKKNKNPNVQPDSIQKNVGKRKSFTVKKDQIIQSQVKKKTTNKIFLSEKKSVLSEQQTKDKKNRIISAKIESKKSSKVNSKMNTPQKKKRTIVSAKNQNQNFQSIEQNPQKGSGEIEMNRKSSKKNIDSTYKKGKHLIESQIESGFKMVSKNIMTPGPQAKIMKKSQASISQKNMFMTRNTKIYKNLTDKPVQSLQNLEKSSTLNNDVTNFSEKGIKKSLSYNGINKGVIAFSQQPLLLLKEKKKIEKELKEKSRQNLKLKEQLSKLQKYEDEYYQMREIFERFEREKRYHKSRR